jgi:membrane-associated HD superfamily phosphohydrolase
MLITSPASPIINASQEIDSSVFITVAKEYLNNDKIPYRDTFDHKGPLLYLINIVGLIIGNGNIIGIWIIEIVFLFISVIFLYKISILLCNKHKEMISSFIIFVFFVMLYKAFEGGNYTEEYSLPFTFISLYLFIKHLKLNEKTYNPKDMLIHGIMCGSVIMLRANILALWITIAIITIMELINEKNLKNLFSNILAGFCGILISTLPFVIYFYANNALKDMLYCIFEFNFIYSSSNLESIIKSLLYFISFDIFWAISLFRNVGNEKRK